MSRRNQQQPDSPPHPGVLRPVTFIHTQGEGCIVAFTARPAGEIASRLLEDIGGWWRALRAVPADAEVPDGVADALNELHEVVCNWTELLDAHRASQRRRVRAALTPPDPGAA